MHGMSSAAAARRWTADEFAACPESEGFELVHGVPRELPMSDESSWVGGELFALLWTHVRTLSGFPVFPADTPVKAWPQWPNHFRKPDVAVVKADSLPGGRLSGGTLSAVPVLEAESSRRPTARPT